MARNETIWLGLILILAAWFFLHQKNLSRGTQAFADELLDVGLEDFGEGLLG